MSEENIKYKFENLQPINFLKRFNKMVEDDEKKPVRNTRKQLKVFPLTKFPLPQFYKNMEGIFETGVKKKDIASNNTKNKEDIAEEQFLEKHHEFMAEHIKKIMDENQAFQNKLESERQYIETQNKQPEHNWDSALAMMRARSQPKLKKAIYRKKTKMTTQHENVEKQRNIKCSSNKQKDQDDVESIEENEKLTYLEKINLKKIKEHKNPKKQRIRMKEKKQINDMFESKKDAMGHSRRPSSLRHGEQYNYNNMNAEDYKKDFIGNLLALQKQQNQYKDKFHKSIEDKIVKFNETVSKSIKQIKSQRYW